MFDEPESAPNSAAAQLRPMLPGDILTVRQILCSSPEAADWTEQSIRDTLEHQHSSALVTVRGGEISGCIFGAKIAEEAEILNLAVKPAHRRKGDASKLVRQLLAAWDSQRTRRIFLEVRESNAPAIRLYESLGFHQIGRRLSYYADPTEDALVLSRTLNQ